MHRIYLCIFILSFLLSSTHTFCQQGKPQKLVKYSKNQYVETDYYEYNTSGNLTSITGKDSTTGRTNKLQYFNYDDQ